MTALAAPASASAHAILVRSAPLPGAELTAPPSAITDTFSEPLNRALTSLTVTGARGRAVRVRVRAIGTETIELVPVHRLARGVYEVRWHSVSALDGHELDGSYYFGVGAAAPAGSTSSLSDPLADDGWLRVLLHALTDAALLFLCGGVFCAALLADGRSPAAWLLPAPAPPGEGRGKTQRAQRLWRRVVVVGAAGIVFDAASTIADAANAGGGLSGTTLHAFLLANATGVARLVLLGALALTVALAALRLPIVASIAGLLALGALTVAGHANSASPRGLAIVSDLAHLAAGAVWLGGVTQIAWAWVGRVWECDRDTRRRIMREVLGRFGRVALPAFAVVVVAGAVNAAVELGSLSALWNDAYGRVLAVKAALVGAIALASYVHALRIRPRLLSRVEVGDDPLERRHWTLVGIEPALAAGVVLAAALLVAYAAPNRSAVAAAASARRIRLPSASQPLNLPVARGQLSVAEEAGPDIVAAWVTRGSGRLHVQVHALNVDEEPAAIPVRLPQAVITGRCGPGCYSATVPASTRVLTVGIDAHGTNYAAELPIGFSPDGSGLAQRLVNRVSAAEVRLGSAVVHESLRGSPTPPDITVYEIQAPDRFAYQLSRAGRPIGATIIIGTREWTRAAGQGAWQGVSYGPQPWSASSYLSWWGDYADSPRLLDLRRVGSLRIADVATLDEIPGLGPVWLRLELDLTHDRLLRLRMITAGHFMTQAWGTYDQPQRIEPPGR